MTREIGRKDGKTEGRKDGRCSLLPGPLPNPNYLRYLLRITRLNVE